MVLLLLVGSLEAARCFRAGKARSPELTDDPAREKTLDKRRSEKKFASSSSNNSKNAIPAMHNMALRF